MTRRKKNKKKVVLIVIGVIIGLIILGLVGFWTSLRPVSKTEDIVGVVIENGDSKKSVATKLKNAGLIRNKYSTLLYIFLNGNKNIQAGSYEFSRNMSTGEIIKYLNNGDIVEAKKPTVSITFPEGITLKKYLELLAQNTNLEYDVMIKDINDKSFLKGLIADYWFLTDDILDDDIYYALEGYLFPNTYEFYKNTSLSSVIRKMLNETSNKLEPFKDAMRNSGYSVHEILTMASIAEKEAVSDSDRAGVTQVIYKRLELNMSLGMDVTAYYGVGKDMKEAITSADLNDDNPYNTRLVTFLGLPAGPICNPSLSSVKAVLNPADTNYIYFFADIKTGEVHFTDDASEFESFKKKFG